MSMNKERVAWAKRMLPTMGKSAQAFINEAVKVYRRDGRNKVGYMFDDFVKENGITNAEATAIASVIKALVN